MGPVLSAPDDVLTLAKDLHKRLWPEEPDAQQQLDDAKNGKEKGSPSEGKGKEGDKPAKDGEKDESKEERRSVVKWEDLVMADHTDGDKSMSRSSFIDWEGKENKGVKFTPARSNQIKVIKIYNG